MDIQRFFTGLSEIFAGGQLDRVSEYLHRNLADAEAGGDRHGAVTVLNEMTGYFRSISDYPQAIRAGEQAIAAMRSLGYEGSVDFGTTLLNAATAFRAAGDTPKAMALYTEARAIYERLLPEHDTRLAGLYNNISSVHQAEGRYEQARGLLHKALAIVSGAKDARFETATVSTNLALVLLALHEDAEAMAALHAALEIFEQGTEKTRRDPHYAAALAGLGQAHYRMRQYSQSAAAYERALAHIEACYGKNKDFAVTSKSCAVAWDALGEHEKAAQHRAAADSALARLEG